MVNRKGIYARTARPNAFADIPQAMQWRESPAGQHIEVGIAEHNLFLLLGALGLTRELSGETLLPIGTLYDPFVTRGLDALYHALYAGARFVVAATPSGVSLSPEGGAHQSVITPGIGIALPGIVYWEPAFAKEVEWILLDGLARMGRGEGESLYLRVHASAGSGLAPRRPPRGAAVIAALAHARRAREPAGSRGHLRCHLRSRGHGRRASRRACCERRGVFAAYSRDQYRSPPPGLRRGGSVEALVSADEGICDRGCSTDFSWPGCWVARSGSEMPRGGPIRAVRHARGLYALRHRCPASPPRRAHARRPARPPGVAAEGGEGRPRAPSR